VFPAHKSNGSRRGKINSLCTNAQSFYLFVRHVLPQQDTLIELRLTDNLLGDSLNPIFSTVEFQALNSLKLLDLSGNKIKAIEEGILKGCTKLDVSFIIVI
jgi:Leucine-rich repeat (LRR) protein